MSQAAKAQEPSMEEILASIRRIIADDDSAKPPAKPAASAPTAPMAAAQPFQPAPSPQPATSSTPVAAPSPAPSAAAEINPDDAGLIAEEGEAVAPQVEHDNVLDLTESMATSASAGPSFQTIDGESDIVFTEPGLAPAPQPLAPAPEERSQAAAFPPPPPQPAASPSPQSPPPLMSNTTATAVDSAFNSLAQTVLVHNARTLDDLVREMLRPLLKSWLDDNLPSIVERIVRTEIERVSRGRG